MSQRAARLVRGYLFFFGSILLVQGMLSLGLLLVSDRFAKASDGVLGSEPRHPLIHIAWGVAMLIAVRLSPDARSLARFTLVFGVFYVGLGVTGMVLDNPLGMQLGRGENRFHLLVGPIALVLGALAWCEARATDGQTMAADRVL
jgi:hypothetical protein